jgi:integrase
VKGIYKRGEIYWFVTPMEGGAKRKMMSLKTRDYVEAVQRAVDFLRRSDEVREVGGGAWDEAVGAYLNYKSSQGKHRPASSVNATVALKIVGEILGKPRPSLLNRKRVEGLVASLNGRRNMNNSRRKISASTVASYMRIFKAFVLWLFDRGELVYNPIEGLALPKSRKTRRTEFFSPEERDLVLAQCERDDLRLILLMGFYCGMRFVEILAMRWDWFWFDGDRGSVSIQATDYFIPKGKAQRDVPLHPLVLEYLVELRPKGKRVDRFVLEPLRSKWKEAPSYRFDPKKGMIALFERSGLKWTGYHKLRHSFATRLLLRGVSLSEVASLLGDELIVAQNHYAGFLPGTDDSVSLL